MSERTLGAIQYKVEVEQEYKAWITARDRHKALGIRREASIQEREARVIEDQSEVRKRLLQYLVPEEMNHVIKLCEIERLLDYLHQQTALPSMDGTMDEQQPLIGAEQQLFRRAEALLGFGARGLPASFGGPGLALLRFKRECHHLELRIQAQSHVVHEVLVVSCSRTLRFRWVIAVCCERERDETKLMRSKQIQNKHCANAKTQVWNGKDNVKDSDSR